MPNGVHPSDLEIASLDHSPPLAPAPTPAPVPAHVELVKQLQSLQYHIKESREKPDEFKELSVLLQNIATYCKEIVPSSPNTPSATTDSDSGSSPLMSIDEQGEFSPLQSAVSPDGLPDVEVCVNQLVSLLYLRSVIRDLF